MSAFSLDQGFRTRPARGLADLGPTLAPEPPRPRRMLSRRRLWMAGAIAAGLVGGFVPGAIVAELAQSRAGVEYSQQNVRLRALEASVVAATDESKALAQANAELAPRLEAAEKRIAKFEEVTTVDMRPTASIANANRALAAVKADEKKAAAKH